MTTFKIATWNVNSLRVRLPQMVTWLAEAQPDVLALQETKIQDEDFPFSAIHEIGYDVIYSGQKTYNGVAVLYKSKVADIITNLPELDDPQRRLLGVTINDVRLLNVYIPNGESVVSEKYQYKLNWLHHFDLFLKQELAKYPKLVVVGDFNIAPEDIDTHDPQYWQGKVLCSDPERQAFRDMLQAGLADCFRQLNPTEKSFSWWDYRMYAFKRNLGMRIDHVLASNVLAKHCSKCYIDKSPRANERPSDHTPVIAEFTIS